MSYLSQVLEQVVVTANRRNVQHDLAVIDRITLVVEGTTIRRIQRPPSPPRWPSRTGHPPLVIDVFLHRLLGVEHLLIVPAPRNLEPLLGLLNLHSYVAGILVDIHREVVTERIRAVTHVKNFSAKFGIGRVVLKINNRVKVSLF